MRPALLRLVVVALATLAAFPGTTVPPPGEAAPAWTAEVGPCCDDEGASGQPCSPDDDGPACAGCSVCAGCSAQAAWSSIEDGPAPGGADEPGLGGPGRMSGNAPLGAVWHPPRG